jgi:hypothetical protein
MQKQQTTATAITTTKKSTSTKRKQQQQNDPTNKNLETKSFHISYAYDSEDTYKSKTLY